MNRRATELDLAVLDGVDALVALHEVEVDIRRTYRDVKVAEARSRQANHRTDTLSQGTKKSA